MTFRCWFKTPASVLSLEVHFSPLTLFNTFVSSNTLLHLPNSSLLCRSCSSEFHLRLIMSIWRNLLSQHGLRLLPTKPGKNWGINSQRLLLQCWLHHTSLLGSQREALSRHPQWALSAGWHMILRRGIGWGVGSFSIINPQQIHSYCHKAWKSPCDEISLFTLVEVS